MTRYEWIKNASKEELAEMLCNLVDNVVSSCDGGCMDCVAREYCKPGETGFIKWLDKEVEFTENTKDFKVYE